MKKSDPWKLINRCVICGGKLTFIPSPRMDALEHEGKRQCHQNHGKFTVHGEYDAEGMWTTRFQFPLRMNDESRYRRSV